MADQTGDLRLIKIESVEESHGNLQVASSTSTDNMFDKIRVSQCNFLKEISEDLESIVGDYLFVNISKVRSDIKIAKARPHKSGEIGCISSEIEKTGETSKVFDASFNQGDNKAKLGSEYVYTNSPAIVNTDGKIELTINLSEGSYTAEIISYEQEPPSTGDIVGASVPNLSSLSTATVVEPNIDYIINLEGEAPHTGKFEVEIISDTHPIRGKIRQEVSEISIGDHIEHNLRSTGVNHSVSNGSVDFELELEDEPITTGDVTIEITETSPHILGEVI